MQIRADAYSYVTQYVSGAGSLCLGDRGAGTGTGTMAPVPVPVPVPDPDPVPAFFQTKKSISCKPR